MKTDIDELMKEQGVDYLLVTGPAQHNPPMVYMTGGGHLTQADLIKKRGQEPILFHSSMERDEAAQTGLPTRYFDDYRITDLLKQTGGDMVKAIVKRYQGMFADLEIGVVESADLTPRELEVLELLGQNMTNHEIAEHLVIEVGTVKNHVHSILNKLNVNTRSEAAAYLALINQS